MRIDDFHINPKQIARISEPIISNQANTKGQYFTEIFIQFSGGATHSIIQFYDSKEEAQDKTQRIVKDLISKIEQ